MAATRPVARRANVHTLAIVRPMGTADTNEFLAQPKNPGFEVQTLDSKAPATAIFDRINKTVQYLQGGDPNVPVDIITVIVGGSGSGKGLTLLGKEEEPGIAQLLFQQQKKRAQVLELETAPTPGSFTVKDLTSPTSKPQTIHRHQHDSNLSNTIKHFKRCTANCLRDVEKRRDTLEVEHAQSSRTVVVMTSHDLKAGGPVITIIDPPGRESPKALKTTGLGRAPPSRQGTGINRTYSDLLRFIQIVQKGNLKVSGKQVSVFTSLLPLHQSGNQILLCVIGVLYGDRQEPTEATTRKLEMASRDVETKSFILELGGTSRQDLDRITSQGHSKAIQGANETQKAEDKLRYDYQHKLPAGRQDKSGLSCIGWQDTISPLTTLQECHEKLQTLVKSMGEQVLEQRLMTEYGEWVD